jgi:hypothetical protein
VEKIITLTLKFEIFLHAKQLCSCGSCQKNIRFGLSYIHKEEYWETIYYYVVVRFINEAKKMCAKQRNKEKEK